MAFGIVIDRNEAETYWQPAPSHGTRNCLDADAMIPPHYIRRAGVAFAD